MIGAGTRGNKTYNHYNYVITMRIGQNEARFKLKSLFQGGFRW